TPEPGATETPPSATPADEGGDTPTPEASETPTDSIEETATPEPTCTPAPAPAALATGGAGTGMPAAAVEALNQIRTNSGRTALSPNSTLAEAATQYARSMAEQSFFSHDGQDGSSPEGRIVAAGYGGRFM